MVKYTTYQGLSERLRELEGEIRKSRQVEVALRESEERFRDLFENANDLIQSVRPDGTFQYVNRAWLDTLGYQEEEVADLTLMDVIHPDSLSHCTTLFQQLMDGEEIPPVEAIFLTKNGSHVTVEGNVNCRFFNGQPISTRGIFRNITEQKKSEERRRRSTAELNQIFNLAADGIRVVDLDYNILRINETFLRIFGMEGEDRVGKKCYHSPGDLLCHTPDCPMQRIASGEQRVETEIDYYKKNGERVTCILTAIPFLDADGELIGIIEDVKDISRKKEAEDALQKSLAEKEVLLQEIHHRVKNNMQVISSLLYLQSGRLEDDVAKRQFQEAQNRIQSMALAHDNLYRSKDIANVDLGSYTEQLVIDRLKNYGIDQEAIAYEIDLSGIKLPIDRALPCGLLINELFTNALKYAFPDQVRGKIEIRLYPPEEGMYKLTVRDNGVGLPEGLEIDKSKTFGLMLVSLLTDQLHGTLDIDSSDQGACFTVRFAENIS